MVLSWKAWMATCTVFMFSLKRVLWPATRYDDEAKYE